MCGIVGYVGKRSAQDVLLDGLEKLEYRGYDSAGVALALDGGIRVVKSKGRLTALREKLAAQQLAQSFCGIGHTRWATHGEPSDVNSHPHSTPRVSIVHNGIIENYGLLKERLAAKGYTFQSETDTEVLVKLIDSCYTGDPLRALQQALAKVRGSYALAVLFRDYPDTIFAVKRESPLIVGWGEGENFVASDIPALLKYTRKYSVLEEGDMAVCTTEGIRFYNEFGEPVERQQLKADWDMEAAEKGGYPHFMLKEINEQPAAIMATVSPRVEDGLPVLRIPELTDEVLRGIGRVHLVGCGTAMHAGMVGKSAIETLARVPARWTLPASSVTGPHSGKKRSGHHHQPVRRDQRHVGSAQAGQEPRRAGAGHRECGWQLHCTCRRLCNVHLRRAGDRGSIHQGVYGADVRAVSVCTAAGLCARTAERGRDPPLYGPGCCAHRRSSSRALQIVSRSSTLPAAM